MELQDVTPKPKNDLDKWLRDNIGVMAGCCSGIESLKYHIAQETAEKLLADHVWVLNHLNVKDVVEWLRTKGFELPYLEDWEYELLN